MDEIKEYYNHYDEDGRLLKKNRRPEYLLTMEYIEKYLTDGAKILEIGAGSSYLLAFKTSFDAECAVLQ